MRDDTSSTSSYARMLRQQYAFKHRDMSRSEGSGSSSSPAGPRAETRREGRDGIVCLDKDEYILFLEKEVLRNAAPPPAVVDADAVSRRPDKRLDELERRVVKLANLVKTSQAYAEGQEQALNRSIKTIEKRMRSIEAAVASVASNRADTHVEKPSSQGASRGKATLPPIPPTSRRRASLLRTPFAVDGNLTRYTSQGRPWSRRSNACSRTDWASWKAASLGNFRNFSRATRATDPRSPREDLRPRIPRAPTDGRKRERRERSPRRKPSTHPQPRNNASRKHRRKALGVPLPLPNTKPKSKRSKVRACERASERAMLCVAFRRSARLRGLQPNPLGHGIDTRELRVSPHVGCEAQQKQRSARTGSSRCTGNGPTWNWSRMRWWTRSESEHSRAGASFGV